MSNPSERTRVTLSTQGDLSTGKLVRPQGAGR